jgi:hypothetical protein
MNQMGHSGSSMALEIYAKKMNRNRDTGARMDELIRDAEQAEVGTSSDLAVDASTNPATAKAV